MKFDESTFLTVREQIARAIAVDDEARAYCEARERIEQPDQPEQQGLVYRIFDNAQASPVQATMDAEEQRAWDEWCRAHVAVLGREMEEFAGELGSIIGALENKVEQLAKEIAELRADNAVLKSNNVSMIKRSRDVA
jgi:hypothetical protein